jgi:hypothetical protein
MSTDIFHVPFDSVSKKAVFYEGNKYQRRQYLLLNAIYEVLPKNSRIEHREWPGFSMD